MSFYLFEIQYQMAVMSECSFMLVIIKYAKHHFDMQALFILLALKTEIHKVSILYIFHHYNVT